ncbi:heparan sulfate 2-O-sulfotransferase pipe-like [Macrobrachium nipponense]|uniref:heparan sulfate 2-O-sulfotransferase pipe-like n=1 Tax=Macrobrachium nipponense TaxID=159736 RepID=UPI0030C8664C
MANVILRPRVFVTILVWVVSFCGLLMVWQAPPPSSTSSLLHSPSSSVGSEDSDQEFLSHRSRTKLVPRTHVSNWAYLQPKPRERTDSWKEKIEPWKQQTDSWKEKIEPWKQQTDSWKEKIEPWKQQTDSWKENADSLKERLDSWKESPDSPKERLGSWKERSVPVRERTTDPGARAKPYPKITFRNRESSTRGALGDSATDANLPMSSPITYHRSRIKDATPLGSHALSSLPPDGREEKGLLIHHTIGTKATPNRITKENIQKENIQKEDDEYSTEAKQMKLAADDDVIGGSSYGLRADHEEEEEEYYEEEYVDNGETDVGENEVGRERVGDEEEEGGFTNEEYYGAASDQAVDLGGRFNVTPPGASVVIYNRVPKCASSTMQTILRRLSKHLNFEHVSSLIYDHHQLTREEQEKLVENLTTSLTAAPSHALSYDRHLYYTNFTGLGLNPPVYINIVRDPVERFISSFYYRRSEERLNRIQMHGHSVSPSLSWVNRTVEQCVLLNDPECSFVPGEEKELMLSYFCGHQKFCRIIGNRDAVQMAKHIVSKEYSVVGLVEHMDLSLLLLETLVPRFMEGATEIYGNIRQKEHMVVNINHKKPKVSVAVRDELLRRMSDDIDFYYFLEQRLFEQRKNFLSKR